MSDLFSDEQKQKWREQFQKPVSQFIEEAEKRFGKGKYDFSKVEYVNRQTPVEIICKKHGSFMMEPFRFLSYRGCPKCRKEENDVKYLTRHKEQHGNNEKWDYENTYRDGEKLFIHCEKHGYFNIKPTIKRGCPSCGIERGQQSEKAKERREQLKREAKERKEQQRKIRLSKEIERKRLRKQAKERKLLEKQREKYQKKLDSFSKKVENHKRAVSSYESAEQFIYDYEKLEVRCAIHGEVLPYSACGLRFKWCSECKEKHSSQQNKVNAEKWKKTCSEIHDNFYDYSLVTDVRRGKDNNRKVTIICPEHGKFEQRPHHHLRGQRCPHCASLEQLAGRNEEKHFLPFIEKLGEEFEQQKRIERYEDKGYKCYYIDFYFPAKKLVIEYDEEYHYYNEENQKKDREREEHIRKELDCEIVRVKDKEFMRDKLYAVRELRKYFTFEKYEDVDDLFE